MASCFYLMNDNYNDSIIAANIFVSSEQASFPASNTESHRRRAKIWRTSSVATEQYITWDLGLPTDVESFAMVGRRNSPIQLTPSGIYKLQANPTDAWTSPAFEQALTYDGESMIALSETGLAGTQYRYWRLSLTDTTNSNGYIEIAAIHLGNHIAPTNGRVQFGLGSSMVDRSDIGFSEGGQVIALTRETTQAFSLKWFNLKKAEIEEFEDFFEQVGLSKPFFISMDSNEMWSTAANQRVKYVRFSNEPEFTLENVDIFSMRMSFSEEI